MEKETITFKINENVEKTSERDMYVKGYLKYLIDLKIRTSISGAVNFFKLSSVKELLDGINAGNISILSKPDLKIGEDIIRLPHVVLVYKEILGETSDGSTILKYLSVDKHKIYETSLSYDELKIAGLFDNIESIIRANISKMVEECEKQLELKKVKLINQIMVEVKSILTTNQISIDEFKHAFITGKARLVTLLSKNGNLVPFLFINYNGSNFNTNIYLETISELFENDVDLKELTELLISYF